MNDEMIEQQLINNIGKPLDDYNQTQTINSYEVPTGTGKMIPKVTANTRAVLEIANLPVYHFGCVYDMRMEHVQGRHGTEFTLFSDKEKRFKSVMMLNPRFLSKILYAWSKAVGIRYVHPTTTCGSKLWCTFYSKSTPLIMGTDAIQLLNDLIFMINRKNKSVSDILYNLMNKKDYNAHKRVFHIIQAFDFTWTIPIYNLEYLKSLVKELESGKYILDQEIPIVKKLWNVNEKKCTDYTAKRIKLKMNVKE